MEGSPISVVARFSERAGALKVSIDSPNAPSVRELSAKEREQVFCPDEGPGATWDSTGIGLSDDAPRGGRVRRRGQLRWRACRGAC